MKSIFKHTPVTEILTCQESITIRDGLYDWIENRKYRNPDDSLAKFAESLGVTAAQISEYLRRNMKISYNELRCVWRIKDASLFLLILPDEPVRKIADMVGFSNIIEFFRHFFRLLHYSPVGWRRHHILRNRKRE